DGFFFQAEDGIRDKLVTGVQTCALPISFAPSVIQTHHQNPNEDKHLDQRKLGKRKIIAHENDCPGQQKDRLHVENEKQHRDNVRSEERRVGKERKPRWAQEYENRK